jgi:hypothetical protein
MMSETAVRVSIVLASLLVITGISLALADWMAERARADAASARVTFLEGEILTGD